ncbi:hypothetical protein AB6A40_002158 [Gnathostoma spinigerum]|uniref:Galactosylgalactosylxylosylprotein 3-beta-glucuronosyltransferase n=1 Tax=Gnathostoma spinigerum TaxID=75299 RepID=A0ABD6E5W4_9BILA
MIDQNLIFRVLCAVGLFFLVQVMFFWSKLGNLDDTKLTIEAEIEMLTRKRNGLQMKTWELEKDIHRLQLRLNQIEAQVHERIPLLQNHSNLSTIYFITPTYNRPARKADLTRLAQTLAHVPSILWIIVEDAEEISPAVAMIARQNGVPFVHLCAITPPKLKLNDTDPSWKLPKGVNQRNTALAWLRKNYGSHRSGVVYFGDDDNTYDLRLFEEIRATKQLGVWPVGLVGGLLVETPLVENGKVIGFNAVWKPKRPFPIDMAAFAVSLDLVNKMPDVVFSYDVPRGFQESHFLTSLGLQYVNATPMARNCSKVYVWHTRTEMPKLEKNERGKMTLKQLNDLERDAVG